MSEEYEDSAGGMTYRTMKGIETSSMMKYLEGHDKMSSSEIFEKNKEYYIASANKIIARLELAKIRVKHAKLSKEDKKMLRDRLSHGLNWLDTLKKNIDGTKNNSEFQKAVYYKEWHSVKLIPSGVEGYIITTSIERDINKITDKLPESIDRENLKTAETCNENAKMIFLKLLDLNVDSNFKAAANSRIKAYNEAAVAWNILKSDKYCGL